MGTTGLPGVLYSLLQVVHGNQDSSGFAPANKAVNYHGSCALYYGLHDCMQNKSLCDKNTY
jgi:hypothetical protein